MKEVLGRGEGRLRVLPEAMIAADSTEDAFDDSAAQNGRVGLQTVRDWVVAFNTEDPDGLIDAKAPGAVRALTPINATRLFL